MILMRTIWKYSEPSWAFTENRGGTTQKHSSTRGGAIMAA